MKHIVITGDSFIVYDHNVEPDYTLGEVYPAENTPILTANYDEVCEQETGYVIENGVAKLLNSIREKTLDEAKAEKTIYINMCRDKDEASSPFDFNGELFDYDSRSRERLNSAVLGATIATINNVPSSTVLTKWRLFDNTEKDMTIADFFAFKQAEITRSGLLHGKATLLKNTINDAETLEQVYAVVW